MLLGAEINIHTDHKKIIFETHLKDDFAGYNMLT
jgi:hypothetical protein